jgi:hypothetical protein
MRLDGRLTQLVLREHIHRNDLGIVEKAAYDSLISIHSCSTVYVLNCCDAIEKTGFRRHTDY